MLLRLIGATNSGRNVTGKTSRQYLMQDCGEMALQTVKCRMDTATGKVFKYDGNKLPRVIPTRTRLGLIHGLNMIAFK
ncbi:hypothetical protein TIFTF001_035093 [Ficus carica]|uniref:Uncharacterized protein n=1 Tax=Ficus carica TaxID=3494 RepID=A0AA88JBC0_FICCA|nr:hypothetical protein TIFTF001_035093 [Ficus carica]